ncbi:unnamed protein product [Linum trigynum]|uniref:Uncharacterized protein n=1 Tax=Linum trigynum TaxID=586398 RepID=A0AAV2E6H2_9ROSI
MELRAGTFFLLLCFRHLLRSVGLYLLIVAPFLLGSGVFPYLTGCLSRLLFLDPPRSSFGSSWFAGWWVLGGLWLRSSHVCPSLSWSFRRRGSPFCFVLPRPSFDGVVWVPVAERKKRKPREKDRGGVSGGGTHPTSGGNTPRTPSVSPSSGKPMIDESTSVLLHHHPQHQKQLQPPPAIALPPPLLTVPRFMERGRRR